MGLAPIEELLAERDDVVRQVGRGVALQVQRANQ